MTFVTAFNDMKRIYGICPCCGDPFRLSEAALFTKTAPPRTVFEQMDDAFYRLERRIERFDELEAERREAARRRGQIAARRRIRAIAPFFVERKIVPSDVKVLFHPVDYIVFSGMGNGRCGSVDFIDHPPNSRERETIQRSLERTIRSGNLEWQTFRVNDAGRITLEDAGYRRP